jgi:hypothetical protein
MRSQLGVTLVLTALAAALVSACSSSASTSKPGDAGPTACSDTLANVFALPGATCPVDSSGNPVSYEVAITTTCDALKLKKGDVHYGQCFDYLVFEVDQDSSGHSYTKCFYSVSTHALVGVVFADGQQDQCGGSSLTVQGGTVDPSCAISGASGGGGFVSCAPSTDGGTAAD